MLHKVILLLSESLKGDSLKVASPLEVGASSLGTSLPSLFYWIKNMSSGYAAKRRLSNES